MSDDDEFDLPNAEEYFTALEAKVTTTHPQSLPEDGASREFDDDLDQGTAAHACLGLPEILERIIQFVPPLEVYRLQRVSTLFRDLISRSKPIRRYMYFVPEKYFVRSELNELLGFQEYSKLGEAIRPFRVRLYAHKDKIGASVEIDPHWSLSNLKCPPKALFASTRTSSWGTILIKDSVDPLHVDLKLCGGDGPWPDESVSQLTGLVTLGDLVTEAKRLTEEAWEWRKRTLQEWREEDILLGFDSTSFWYDDDNSEEGSDDYSEDDFEDALAHFAARFGVNLPTNAAMNPHG
ncbi:hypothetical protein M409DRAFT_23949 [Zasmidium cellare ATCC 36951]|uniref:F-box domain-containing protein n=1 Tax=Zasmidium cellare ATCC 36951 TaxID=1080233 RepID=A0A6A6CIY9_ZASCE|nr:uncharacterized protein M409DRAFT_23949 [Zasmidium cellare ATCC 36951]KAF2165659.1 hypothetical protein M409DRAFT_23949 [Zasmidium cellare ATCC 36951]